MINVMQKYLSNKIKPNYPYYKFFILNTSKYTYEIIDIFKDVIGEAEVVSYERCSVIFYFNNIDFDFKSLIKTINDDFYTDAHLFESGKIQFGDATELSKILDIYNKAGLSKYTYTSNKNILAYLINRKEQAKDLAPVLLNKLVKDESLLMLANDYFEKYNLITNNCVQVVYDALDYCDLGYVRRIENRIRHIIPAYNGPYFRKTEIALHKKIKQRSCSGGSCAYSAYFCLDDNGFHILDRYRL